MKNLQKKLLIPLITLFLGAFIFLPFNNFVSAQGLQVQGLGIDPFLIEIDMAAGEVQTRSITLTNTTNAPLTFTASINDFVPNGSTGQPQFLDANVESDSKFSLSRWITVTRQPEFTIPPQSQTEVAFTINVPVDAEPGTHFGGILFGQPLGIKPPSGPAVIQKAGAIILVKLGESQEKVQVSQFFTQQKVYQSGPIEFLISLHNFGNVHSKPKGDITIRNFWGRQVAQVPVNPDAQIILPESGRDFSQTWNKKIGFGRYTAESVLYYGSPKLELRSQTSFWIIPMKEISLGVLFALILGIIGYIGVRQYNKYIIKHSRDEN